MFVLTDFDATYNVKPDNKERVPSKSAEPFIGSYAPISKPGEEGPFNVNTYLLQPNRKVEIAGPVRVRSTDIECRRK